MNRKVVTTKSTQTGSAITRLDQAGDCRIKGARSLTGARTAWRAGLEIPLSCGSAASGFESAYVYDGSGDRRAGGFVRWVSRGRNVESEL